jgi:SAM-dependent methyltransferase
MSEITIEEAFKKYQFYHTIDLGNGVVTPGFEGVKNIQDRLTPIISSLPIQGKRVLDIGFRDGYFSFLSEKLGAQEVVGVDNCVVPVAREFLKPYLKSKVSMVELNLFDLTPNLFGKFDIVFYFGVLYHIRYPMWSFKVLRDVLKNGGYMLVETAVLRDYENEAILFCPVGTESPYEDTSVTFFNQKGMESTMASLGFSLHSKLMEDSGNRVERGIFVFKYDRQSLDPKLLKYWESTHTANVSNNWDDWS